MLLMCQEHCPPCLLICLMRNQVLLHILACHTGTHWQKCLEASWHLTRKYRPKIGEFLSENSHVLVQGLVRDNMHFELTIWNLSNIVIKAFKTVLIKPRKETKHILPTNNVSASFTPQRKKGKEKKKASIFLTWCISRHILQFKFN